jgi:hypothetical protein
MTTLFEGRPSFGEQICVNVSQTPSAIGEFGIPSDNLDASMIIDDGSHILLQDNMVEGLRHHHSRVGMVAYLTDESNNVIQTLFKL